MNNELLDDFGKLDELRKSQKGPEERRDLLKLIIITLLAIGPGIALYFLISLLNNHYDSYVEYGFRISLISLFVLHNYTKLVEKVLSKFITSAISVEEELSFGYLYMNELLRLVLIMAKLLIPCFLILSIVSVAVYFEYKKELDLLVNTFNLALIIVSIIHISSFFYEKKYRINKYYNKEIKAKYTKKNALENNIIKIEVFTGTALLIAAVFFYVYLYCFYVALDNGEFKTTKNTLRVLLLLSAFLIYNYGIAIIFIGKVLLLKGTKKENWTFNNIEFYATTGFSTLVVQLFIVIGLFLIFEFFAIQKHFYTWLDLIYINAVVLLTAVILYVQNKMKKDFQENKIT